MNINPVSFKGTFCLNINDLSTKAVKKINSKEDKYSISTENGGYTEPDKIFMSVPYEMDSKVNQMLRKLSVNYDQIDEADALSSDNIISRIILPPCSCKSDNILQNINVKKLDSELKKDSYFYVGYNGENGLDSRYEKFKRFLKTNQQIVAPIVKAEKLPNKEIKVCITDGRHRFAVLRDMGIQNIPVCIDKESLKYAEEMGLI